MTDGEESYDRDRTVEGNKANWITGRAFDLTNPDHVREIVLASRGIADPGNEIHESHPGACSADGAETPAGGGSSVTDRDPFVYINSLLRAYTSVEGHVRSPTTGAPDTVAGLVHHPIRRRTPAALGDISIK